MSVNLTLLPLWGGKALEEPHIFCGTQLHLDADNELIEMISGLSDPDSRVEAFPIPEGAVLQYYGEGGLVETRNTEVGGLLHFAYAGDFRKLEKRRRKCKMRHVSSTNKAAIAYCAALPKDAPVFLNWC